MSKTMGILGLMAVALGLAALPVHAEGDGACRDDIKRLCGDVKPGGGSIHDCMKSHEAEVSQTCKDNMAKAKEHRQEKVAALKESCQADLQKFCANVTPGEGREFACLRAYEDQVSPVCKEKMPQGHGMMMGKHKGEEHKKKK